MSRGAINPLSQREEPILVLFSQRPAAGIPLTLKPKKKKSQLGQATLEYALLIFLMAGFAVAFNSTFVQFLNKGIVRLNAVIERELCSGGFNEAPTLWEN